MRTYSVLSDVFFFFDAFGAIGSLREFCDQLNDRRQHVRFPYIPLEVVDRAIIIFICRFVFFF